MAFSLQKILASAFVFAGLFFSGMGDADAQQIVQVGTDTTSNNNYSPIGYTGTYGKNKHYQILYTLEDLKALGVSGASIIDSFALNIKQATAMPLPNFGIKMKNTSAATIGVFDGVGLTQVYLTPSYVPQSEHWDWYPFQTNFTWDGYSNLLVDICFDSIPSASFTSSGKVYFTSKITGKVVYSSVTSSCSKYTSEEIVTNRPNAKFSFRAAPACAGTPTAPNVSPGGTLNVCAATPITLHAFSTSGGEGLKYSWEYSEDNGANWKVVAGLKEVTPTFSPVVNTQYRSVLTCANSDQSVKSNIVTINTSNTGILYRRLPYAQDFEEWISRCDKTELPDSNWTAYPVKGNQSWRREDQGATAAWTGTVVPSSYPVMAGDHSARFHTCSNVGSGNISVYLDCSGPGEKEMRFDYINKTGGSPRMDVLLSTDGGNSFTLLKTLNSMGVSAVWLEQVIPFVSTSANTVIKFNSYSYVQSGDYDMGINKLRILEPCVETPVAGTVDSVSTCSGEGLRLSLSGSTFSAGLKWLWQESTDGIGWANVAGGDIEHPTVSITKNTWYRCILTCSNTGFSDTSAPQELTIKPFYNCYCNSASTTASPSINIGNVQLASSTGGSLLLDNGNPLPATKNLAARNHYSNFLNLLPIDLFRDSSYKLKLTFFTENGTNVRPMMSSANTKIFIDYNRNGEFEQEEQVWGRLKAADIYEDSCVFMVPKTAFIGNTGLRIVTNASSNYDTSLTKACGPYGYGETEDYVVRINDIPCRGNEITGSIAASDTSFCPGYPFRLTHSGADSTAGLLNRMWQSSTDGTSWNDIANTSNSDILNAVFAAPSYYRVKTVCGLNSAETYTDSVKIGQDALCYCPSFATGGFAGAQDSSDFGSFKIGTIDLPMVGGHLNNALAVNKYVNYTHLPAPLFYADSTYSCSLDHILVRNDHADAKVTLFIDYNANGIYDIPGELVYSSMSTNTTWHKTAKITIPSDVTVGKETGMRLIINNDTTANIPSDEACGTYISGETEDFRVIFKKAELPVDTGSTGMENISMAANAIHIFPNPSTGIVAIQYKGSAHKNSQLKVQNVAGQLLNVKTFQNLADGSVLKLDLSTYSRGIYFITLDADGVVAKGKVVIQ